MAPLVLKKSDWSICPLISQAFFFPIPLLTVVCFPNGHTKNICHGCVEHSIQCVRLQGVSLTKKVLKSFGTQWIWWLEQSAHLQFTWRRHVKRIDPVLLRLVAPQGHVVTRTLHFTACKSAGSIQRHQRPSEVYNKLLILPQQHTGNDHSQSPRQRRKHRASLSKLRFYSFQNPPYKTHTCL